MTVEKRKRRFWLLPLILASSIIFICSRYLYEKFSIERSSKINFEYAADSIYVNKIRFERNSLYPKAKVFLNDTLYDTYITYVSLIHQIGSTNKLKLDDILPPFTLTKKENNDTIHIIKDNKKYYLLISEELERRKNQ